MPLWESNRATTEARVRYGTGTTAGRSCETLRPPSFLVDEPLSVHPDAYVADNVLVAHFTNAFVPNYLALAPDSVHQVAQLVLQGRLTFDGNQWALEDLIVATTVKVNELLNYQARLPILSDPAHPLCEIPSLYMALEKHICSYEDISSSPSSGPSPCDALSGATLVQAKQAQLGSVRPAAAPLPSCSMGLAPDMDMCQSLAGP